MLQSFPRGPAMRWRLLMPYDKTSLLRMLILVISTALVEGCARDVTSHGNTFRTISRPDPPSTYVGKTNPVSGEAAIAAGRKLFAANCVSCHGNTGKGDGLASPSLNPNPTDFAKTIGGLKDDYLFWRISEGGAFPPFNSAMIGRKAKLSEEDRWNLIAYLRTLRSK